MKDLSECNLGIYPYPIAAVLERYRAISQSDYTKRHLALKDVFESTIRIVAVICLNEASAFPEKMKKCFPRGFDFLKRPLLGHWLGIVRDSGNAPWDDKTLWLYRINLWYSKKRPGREILDVYADLPETKFPGQVKSGPRGVAESILTYRNNVWGHGAGGFKEDDLKRRVTALERLLSYLLEEADFFEEMNLFLTKEVKVLDKENRQMDCTSLMGRGKRSVQYSCAATGFSPAPEEIYLCYSPAHEQNLIKEPVLLSPLVEWKKFQDQEPQFYFYDGARRTHLDYLCYITGHHHHQQETGKVLENLLNIRLEKHGEYEEIEYNNSEETRRDRSESAYRRGKKLLTEGNCESAIIEFENALMWFRTPKIIVAMCEAMYKLEDNKEYILYELENAFEIDPHYEPAKNLQKRIGLSEEKANLPQQEKDETESFNLVDGNFTFYDLIIPRRYRNFAPLIWTFSLFLFYFASGVLQFILEPENGFANLSVCTLYLIETTVFVLVVYSAKARFLDSYWAMLGQVSNIPENKFNKWFGEKYNELFGSFVKTRLMTENTDSEDPEKETYTWKIKVNTKNEKGFLIASGIFLFLWIFAIFFVHNLPGFKSAGAAFIRFLDTAVVWITIVPAVRYVILSTLMIKEFSKFDLNPVISAAGNDGFSKMSQIFAQNMIIAIFFYMVNWSWNVIAVRDPLYLDFIGLLLALVIILFWLIFTPRYINRSLKISKSKATSQYQDHLGTAFKEVLKSPDENSYQELQWLKEKEKAVLKISTRLFSFPQKILYVLTWLVVISITSMYILIRVDYIRLYALLNRLNQLLLTHWEAFDLPGRITHALTTFSPF